MADTVSTVAASPDLISVGAGKDAKMLKMAPLHLRAIGHYERWVQRKLSSAVQTMTPELLKHIASTGYWSDTALGTLATTAGQTMICWLGVNIEQPEIPFEWFEANITIEQLKAAMVVFNELNYPPVPESKKAEAAGAAA